MPFILSALGSAASGWAGRLATFSVALDSAGDGSCVDPVSVSLSWTDSPAITDDYVVKLYENYSTTGYPSVKGTLIHTENSPKTTQSRLHNTPLADDPGSIRWYFRYDAELYDPDGNLLHSKLDIFSRKGTEC